MIDSVTVVIPAKNEERPLRELIPKLQMLSEVHEIIVVDDGSTDETGKVCEESGIRVISHPYSKGNGAAIKTGARIATGSVLVFMDADGQHDPADIPLLLRRLNEGFDLVVGARESGSQASFGRSMANKFYNRIASYMTGQNVKDLTSGFRAVRKDKFLKFLSLLPNGFSYPTTSTMAFFRSGYSVCYEVVNVESRIGRSHIRPFQDGLRFLLIIFKIGTLYSPLKLFLPLSVFIFITGCAYYGYTYFSMGRFTNMSALMFSTSLIIFLVGLVSEQITALMYKDSDET